MKLETFFENFDDLSEAPNAVAKMRQLVLQFAVQGRLVPQSSADGSGVELLAEIARNTAMEFDWKNYQPIDPPLATLPSTWKWAPTSVLCDLQTGKRMKGGAQQSGVISLGGEHVKPDGTVDYSIPRFVSREFYEEMQKGQVRLGDTLMVKDGATTGKTAFVDFLPEGGAAVNEHVFILRWHEPMEKRLAFYFIRGFALAHIATKSAGLIGGIRREAVLDFPFPVPPLVEQKRIVAKLDELMSLCDRLATQQLERKNRHVALARASLARFYDAPTPSNLNFLFHGFYTISPADLRKSILSLAVQGKLVPQDPNDEAIVVRSKKEESSSKKYDVRVFEESLAVIAVPPQWLIEPLAKVASAIVDCPHSTPKWTSEGKICVRTNQFRPGRLDLSDVRFVSEETYMIRIQRLEPIEDDILYSREGGILGIACRVPPNTQLCLGQRMMLIRTGLLTDSAFLEIVLNSPLITGIAAARTTGGAAPRVNVDTVRAYPIPLPPIAEQKRIVAKVNQLMTLCDELEAKLRQAEADAETLMNAAVQHVLTLVNQPTFEPVAGVSA